MSGLAQPVVFIGPMAAGKTAVGRRYAERTGRSFFDTDREIVRLHGEIAALFGTCGEAGFRRIEASIVQDVFAQEGTDLVVSLGGGAIADPQTRELLGNAVVVFLDTDLATVLPRIEADRARPLLADDPATRWLELYESRHQLYTATADHVVDTRRLRLDEVVDRVQSCLADAPANTRRTTGHEH